MRKAATFATGGKRMKRLAMGLAAWTALILGTGVSSGSEPWAFRVYQPFLLQDGIAVSPITYTGYYGPGLEVGMTCWPNRIWHEHERAWSQENAAFMTGLTVSIAGTSLRGDTIVATLDVSKAHTVLETKLLGFLPRACPWPNESLVQATIECMKANAAQWPEAHYLSLRIRGDADLKRYEGVFNVSDRACGPKTRQF